MYYKEDLINYFAAITAGPVDDTCCDGCRLNTPHRKVMKAQRRPQRQKQNVRRIQELRRSNAAGPIPSATEYNRKDKYPLKYEEDDTDFSVYDWS